MDRARSPQIARALCTIARSDRASLLSGLAMAAKAGFILVAVPNSRPLEPDGDRLAVRNYLYPYARVIARALAARVAEGF